MRRSTREGAARNRRDPASRASTVMRSPRRAGGARRRDLRPAGGKIDRDIANGFARERAARRARQRDARQAASLGKRRRPRERATAARACPWPRSGRRATPPGNAPYADGIETRAGRVELERALAARASMRPRPASSPFPDRARNRSTTSDVVRRGRRRNRAPIPPRSVRSATSPRNLCCSSIEIGDELPGKARGDQRRVDPCASRCREARASTTRRCRRRRAESAPVR